VLNDFAKADAEWLEAMLDAVADAAPLIAAGDAANFMNRVALLTQPPR
jgi:PTH1 family peptidyl-tRNA hydrolase